MTEDKAYLKKVGSNIKRIRIERKMKQVDLAAECDFDRQNMYRIEAGNNNLTLISLRKIAKALRVKLVDLVDV